MTDKTTPTRDMRFPATLAMAWTLAGGLLLGGISVAIMLFTQQMRPPLMLVAASFLFFVGGGIGLAHSLVLGYFGREKGSGWKEFFGALGHGLIYFIPSLLLGWLVAGWVAALPVALMTSFIGSSIAIAAWIMAAVVIYFAASIGWDALTRAYGGWQDRVVGTIATFAVLLSMLVLFYLGAHPIWFTAIKMTVVGKALFSFVVTFWIYGPLITLGLYLLHNKLGRPDIGEVRLPSTKIDWKDVRFNAFHVVAVGVIMALFMLPFYKETTHLPTQMEQFGMISGILLSVAHAVSTELFLRLFLFTSIFYVANKHFSKHPKKELYSVLIAVLLSAIVDGLFGTHDVIDWGIDFWMGLSYIVYLAVQSVAFGFLYWRRGLATAMCTHAAAGILLGVMSI